MGFSLPRWHILINRDKDTAKSIMVTANSFDAAVNGAVISYREKHHPGVRVETYEMMGIIS